MKEIKFLSISPTLKVSHNDQPIEVGQWYNADVNFIIGKKNESHLGEPLGSIRYVAREDNIISNEAVHTVNFSPDKTRPPYSSGKTLIITNDEEVDTPLVEDKEPEEEVKDPEKGKDLELNEPEKDKELGEGEQASKR